jgi:serine/threonine protein kinase
MTVDASDSADDSFDALLADAVCGLESSLADGEGDLDLPVCGALIADRYRIDRLLGQGGMGAVFAAAHVVTGKRVAIKLLRGDPRRRKDAAIRMAREARAAGRIHHPNVVDVYDAGFVGERPFLAMELLEGESLEQRIARGPLPVDVGIALILQVMHGVAAAHEQGIVHRDIKPANIFLSRDTGTGPETPKVLDFGISKLRAAEDELTVTAEGAQVGTPLFMSPEQVRGDALDARADVYALAVTLHYALSQRYPFEARVRSELFAKILREPPVPLTVHRPDVPAGLSSVILRALERDRARRFADVSEFAAALTPFAHPSRRWLPDRHRLSHRLARGKRPALVLMLALCSVVVGTSGSTRSASERADAAPPLPLTAPRATPVPSVHPDPIVLTGNNVQDAQVPPQVERREVVRPEAPRPVRRRLRASEPAPPPEQADKFMSW